MLLGKQLGPYLIERELGSGAMGSVFRGKNVENGQRVAIKIIAPGLTANEGALKRFQREIDILKQLEHPNIARIYRSGKYHGTPFYVMDFLDGESLDRILARRLRLPWEELVNIGQQLCAALQYAHDRGIIHRDLKPGNVMILKDGTVKLTDFGIAKDTDVTALTADNSTVGTAAYMSPEQCRGLRDLTLKSDLYSLGIMFYEVLTGRKPFTADTIIEMFKLHTQGTFERPSRIVLEIPIWLDTLVCQMLEKQPEKRPLNAAMVAESLSMVQMKWEEQQSAGVAAATKRKIDKASVEGKFDAEDKDIARALLGKKKKKKKPLAVIRRGWFTVLLLLLTVGGLAAGAYFAFFKPPDADALYRKLEAQVEAKEYKSRQRAKEMLDTFLSYHSSDPRAPKVRAYRDFIEMEFLEHTTHNRRNAGTFRAENKEEEIAWAALDDEEAGKLALAQRGWTDLAKKKTSEDATTRAWGVLGEIYLKKSGEVEELYGKLKEEVYNEPDTKKLLAAADRIKSLALEALIAEKEGKIELARVHWEELKGRTREDADLRPYRVLAAWQYRELGISK